jgi:hypothetical protein
MDNEQQVLPVDLIQHAYEQKPIEFRQTFDALINDKLIQAIGNKKIEVAQTMFGAGDTNTDTTDNTEVESETEEEDEIT